ncbi:NAD(P)-dependent oxidoreductase [Candidatus Saccharibacteria bacterium]|nr:NAD(P)-dependent oxidoreductase [Candidatus Saccharibacteria bacterium]
MRIVIFGGSGFIGSRLVAEMSMDGKDEVFSEKIDLLDQASIRQYIELKQPTLIINCAGITSGSTVGNNQVFSINILKAVASLGVNPRIIILGSAAEYGLVENAHEKVAESHARKPIGAYGIAKKDEIDASLVFAKKSGLDLIVARVFNPIGTGMNPKQLLPNILSQIEGLNSGQTQEISVSRTDSYRDFFSIDDLTSGLKALASHDLNHRVYNVGSGRATSIGELVDTLIKQNTKLDTVSVSQRLNTPEPIVAACADISRIGLDCGWLPSGSLEKTLEKML